MTEVKLQYQNKEVTIQATGKGPKKYEIRLVRRGWLRTTTKIQYAPNMGAAEKIARAWIGR